MRSAGNFHPEWGYLAPAPSFLRTVRVALVATAIGAVAGAAVVVSLVERPGSNDDTVIAAHALLTRAPVIGSQTAASPASPAAPAVATSAAVPAAPAATPPPNVLASAGKPDQVGSAGPPLPLPAPADATVVANAPVARTAHVPAVADVAVAPDTAAEPRMPARRPVAKRRRYEPDRRQETRSRWRNDGGFGPLFRIFNF